MPFSQQSYGSSMSDINAVQSNFPHNNPKQMQQIRDYVRRSCTLSDD